jgi:hypothetical protein
LNETAVPTQTEKRRLERARTDQLLYVELGTGNGGILLNVSEEGCGVLAIAPMWDAKPHFTFAIGGGRQIQGDAQVAWVDKSKKMGGLRFVDPSPAFREQIRAWLTDPKIPEVAQPELEPSPETDILAPVDASIESPARQRRKQLREEARAKLEFVQQLADNRKAGAPSETQPDKHFQFGEVTSALASRLQNTLENASPPEPNQGSGLHALTYAWPSEPINRPPLVREKAHARHHHADRSLLKGVAAIAIGTAVAALAVAFHQQAGQTLMRQGTSLAGKQQEIAATGNRNGGAGAVRPAPAEASPAPAQVKQALTSNTAERNAEPLDTAGDKSTDATTEAREQAVVPSQPKPQSKEELLTLPPPVPQKPTTVSQQIARENKESHATAEQVQALWSEVEAGDASAEVALGELYARGNGVPKSCAQARMLLNSAAKKGSDQAKQKLDQLADAGCP